MGGVCNVFALVVYLRGWHANMGVVCLHGCRGWHANLGCMLFLLLLLLLKYYPEESVNFS